MNSIEFTELRDRLLHAAKAYYDSSVLLMSDQEYDEGIERIRKFVDHHPELRSPEMAGLLDGVAAGQSEGGNVAHPRLMGSMRKATSLDEVVNFVESAGAPMVVEPKLDGLAVRAVYEVGKLRLVATRGDGHTGEDITSRARALGFLPQRINAPGTLEVRGEVFMPYSSFSVANQIREQSGDTAFANPRNAAAGILRKKDDGSMRGLLSFAAYDVTSQGIAALDGETSYARRAKYVLQLGIGTAAELAARVFHLSAKVTDTETSHGIAAAARVEAIGQLRDMLAYPIDGAVIKVDNLEVRDRLGEDSKSPRWALAYKYEANTVKTRVEEIETSVGRTGRLAIRLRLQPASLGGTTVTYATGHNVSWMEERDIRVGDTVILKRAGDVIPYVESVDLIARPETAEKWTPPAADPDGGQWDKSTLLWRSTDPTLSVSAGILYAASRDCLDIEGVGTEIADALVGVGLTSWTDLFEVDSSELAGLPLAEGRVLGSKTATKIAGYIENAKRAPWHRVVTALGMRGTGRTMSRRLCIMYPTMEALISASEADLKRVEGVGDKKATLLRSEITRVAPQLERLRALGVTVGVTAPAATEAEEELPFSGMTIVVSGAIPGFTRTEVRERIEAFGGRSSGSVSKATSLLISDPSASSKYVNATKLGVRIMPVAEFVDLLL